eukprot:CAMPEP_0198365978 /NCGR_PEP_ID=MMETSP1450-20131203/154450_1 /TAXON_ID=753684 ORGANISM="Madagascaria erythrocladiodes, Strain CCMP3234" /NCGR_SAMPLE_ID=MMETSP1450 /ASSEMBLY_ACC=CAM_ASM_001115 /LENGTH=479 /DNA_ID=CAMNT_0044073441 /DNA_START=1987 /DNA_END=3426 /DNA_ORIENTATION=+
MLIGSGRRWSAARHGHLVATFVVMLTSGSAFALSVFNAPLEALNPAAFGNGVLSTSMALLSLISAPAMLLTSVYLEDDKSRWSKSGRVQRLSVVAVAALALLALACVGIATAAPLLVRCAVAAQGVSMGIFYVVAVELAAAWNRDRVGFAIGVVMAGFGGGSIIAALAFQLAVDTVGVTVAIGLVALTWTTVGCLCLPWMTWPEESNSLHAFQSPKAVGERLTWKQLSTSTPFFLFALAGLFGQAPFATCYAYFFRASSELPGAFATTNWFALVQAVGTLFRFFGGVLSTQLGSLRLGMLIFAVQALGFFVLVFSHSFPVFVVVAMALSCCYSALGTDLAVLCRDIFSHANAAKVFGFAAGISMGLGEAASVALLPWSGNDLRRYYAVLGVVCTLGIVSMMLMKREDRAFPATSDGESHGVPDPRVPVSPAAEAVQIPVPVPPMSPGADDEVVVYGSYRSVVTFGTPMTTRQAPIYGSA